MISPQCARGDCHACRPDIQQCSHPCGRNGHPTSDEHPPEPDPDREDLDATFTKGLYDFFYGDESVRDFNERAFDLCREFPIYEETNR